MKSNLLEKLISVSHGKFLHGIVRRIASNANNIRYSKYRCYACGKRGHIAKQCKTICTLCNAHHPENRCMKPIVKALENFEESIKRFTKTPNGSSIESLNSSIDKLSEVESTGSYENMLKDLKESVTRYSNLSIENTWQISSVKDSLVHEYYDANLHTNVRSLPGNHIYLPVPVKKELPVVGIKSKMAIIKAGALTSSSTVLTGGNKVTNKIPVLTVKKQSAQAPIVSGVVPQSHGMRSMAQLNASTVKTVQPITTVKSRIVKPILLGSTIKKGKPTGIVSIRDPKQMQFISKRLPTKACLTLINTATVKRNEKILNRTLRAVKRQGLKLDRLKRLVNEKVKLKNKAVQSAQEITTAAKAKAIRYQERVNNKLHELSNSLAVKASKLEKSKAEKQQMVNELRAHNDKTKLAINDMYGQLNKLTKEINELYKYIQDEKGTIHWESPEGKNGRLGYKKDLSDEYQRLSELKEEKQKLYMAIQQVKASRVQYKGKDEREKEIVKK